MASSETRPRSWAAAHGGINGTGSIIAWDGGLSLLLIAAYVCCRGWTAWSAPNRGLRS